VPRDCIVEVVERRGKSETSFCAWCLTCGWAGADEGRRSRAEQKAENHRAGILDPWQIPHERSEGGRNAA
jgi:hypothetical protein